MKQNAKYIRYAEYIPSGISDVFIETAKEVLDYIGWPTETMRVVNSKVRQGHKRVTISLPNKGCIRPYNSLVGNRLPKAVLVELGRD